MLENTHKRSLESDIGRLEQLMPYIGTLPLDRLHRGSLEPWIAHKRRQGASTGTINHGLKVVRRILNLAAGEWVDEYGLTWLAAAPKMKLLPDVNKRQPYPLSREEQDRLFSKLPRHLANMALFAVNTGCRDGEVCRLKWAWEVKVPALDTSVSTIPGACIKNGDDRLVVLNRIALSVIEDVRGENEEYVFTYREADRMPCPPDFIAATALVALGAIIGARCAIKPKAKDDWLIVPNVWGGIVGLPSAKKSPAIGAALKPLDRLIAQAMEAHRAEMKAFEANKTVFEAKKDAAKVKATARRCFRTRANTGRKDGPA